MGLSTGESMKRINIAAEYSRIPGARYISDGPYSGEDFRVKFLEEHFRDITANYPLEINLDGTEGYATSFLEEAFGGLARLYGIDRCLSRLRFVSEEDNLLVDEVQSYIREGLGRKR
jgi:hypothetical protein